MADVNKDSRRYRVRAMVTISLSTVVEATSKSEAIEMARDDRDLTRFCHQCGGDAETEWATSGELDGVPFDLEAEEE